MTLSRKHQSNSINQVNSPNFKTKTEKSRLMIRTWEFCCLEKELCYVNTVNLFLQNKYILLQKYFLFYSIL